jgi:E3 ubiquitin-protein ligase makorin
MFFDEDDLDGDICPYYASGYCRDGDDCMDLHIDGPIADAMGASAPPKPKGKGVGKSGPPPLPSQYAATDHECGVCLNKIRESGKQYGLLTNCIHTFCIDCIRTWRGRTDIPKDVARGCPICRLNTFVVIPSDVFYSSPEEKQHLI